MPSTSLIVSERVRRGLEAFSALAFGRVVFKKLIRFPYKAGDFSYFKRPAFLRDPAKHDPETLIERMPDVPELHKEVGAYYEVVAPWHERVLESFSEGMRSVPFEVTYLGDEQTSHLQISEPLMRSCPIIGRAMANCGPAIIVREDVFAVLEPFLDWDYFAKSNSVL